MTPRYHERGGRLSPDYLCQQQMIEHYLPACQSIPGGVVDDALSRLILESVSFGSGLERPGGLWAESKKSLEIYQHLSLGAVEQAYQEAVQGVSI
jgi:hypothetical protein